MDSSERAATYETAMRRMDEHIVRGPDGLFMLQVKDATEIDVDPVVFADLQRSLQETNRKILAGEIDSSQID